MFRKTQAQSIFETFLIFSLIQCLRYVGGRYVGGWSAQAPQAYNYNSSVAQNLVSLDEVYSKCNGVDIREITITTLQGLFATNRLTSRELTACYLQRIRVMNPHLNAVLEVNPDALEIAERLDLERKTGHSLRGPLHGIPILVKDNLATNDKMETTAGSLALLGVRPKWDAESVGNLRSAGVVILGKANLAEFSFFRGATVPNAWSGRGGHVKNAYNLSVNPEGSSSGSAVGTSANLATAAIGTETDGSLISPSSMASCVSMKSTYGLISTLGVIPVTFNQDTVGPISRTVEDTAFLLDGMVTKHREEVQSCGGTYGSCLRNDNSDKPYRIGVPRRPFWISELVNSSQLEYEIPFLNEFLTKLSTHKSVKLTDPIVAPWEQLRIITANEAITILHDFKHDIKIYLEEWTYQNSTSNVRTLPDIIEFNKKHPSPEGYTQDLLEMAQATDSILNTTFVDALLYNRWTSREYLNTVLDENELDVIAVPSEPRYDQAANPGFRHSPFIGWTMAAVSGFPSITVPIGYDDGDVPFGICFIGRPFTEVTLLRIAKLVEEFWSGRRAPKFLEN